MDINSTPTEPLPTQTATAPIPVSKRKRFAAGYRFVVIGLLLVATVVLGTFVARWIESLQVTTVFPVAPAVVESTECGVEPTANIPEVEGVAYSQERVGDALVIEATPESKSYKLTGGADTKWYILLTVQPCSEGSEDNTSEAPQAPATDGEDYVGEFIDGAKDVGSEAWDWTKEYGPGIWDRVKELGNGAKESIEEWSQGTGE